jgi:hypothetical protein
MQRVFPKTSFVLFLVTAIVLMPQVHVMESLALGCIDDCTTTPAVQDDADCCDADAVAGEARDVFGDPADRDPEPSEPCDGPCDCPCCVQTVRPAPMIAAVVQWDFVREAPALVVLAPATRPAQASLSVLVQPPIV